MVYEERTITRLLTTNEECLYESSNLGIYFVQAGSSCVLKRLHTHNQFVLEFVDAECVGLVTPAGSSVIERGHYALIAPSQLHYHVYHAQTRTIQVYLPPNYVDDVEQEFQTPLRHSLDATSPHFIHVLRGLVLEAATRRSGHHLMLQTLAMQLVVELMRDQHAMPHLSQLVVSQTQLSPEIRRTVAYMQTDYATDITLDDLASLAGLSRFHFVRLFKHQVGLTPHIYLREIRLERGLTLLKTTQLPIGEIAVQLGFSSSGHFSHAFQQRYAVSPSRIRSAMSRNFL